MKRRVGDPWMPADQYGRPLPVFTVNLIVEETDRAVSFYKEILGATVRYADPDFAALQLAGVEFMVHADHTYENHPWHPRLAARERRGLGAELRVLGPDPDVVEARARERQAVIIQPATTKAHGWREVALESDLRQNPQGPRENRPLARRPKADPDRGRGALRFGREVLRGRHHHAPRPRLDSESRGRPGRGQTEPEMRRRPRCGAAPRVGLSRSRPPAASASERGGVRLAAHGEPPPVLRAGPATHGFARWSDPMMHPFQQVDVFTTTPYLGNPVAVVLDADGLSVEQMQRFASWTNLSETTFVLSPSSPRADYRVHIFTPSVELPFAGHPTLGTCHAWLAAGGEPTGGDEIVQECGVGLVTIRRTGHGLSFAAPPLIRSGCPTARISSRISSRARSSMTCGHSFAPFGADGVGEGGSAWLPDGAPHEEQEP